MAGSVNKVILIGNVGRDPVTRRMGSGDAVVSFTVATSENWRDKASGERKEKTEWHNVVIFNDNIAKVAEQYVRKGTKVYIEGQLQTRKWADKDGVEKYTTEIVLQRFRGELTLLDSRNSGGGDYGRGDFGRGDPGPGEASAFPAPSGGGYGRQAPAEPRHMGGEMEGGSRMGGAIDDDIPF